MAEPAPASSLRLDTVTGDGTAVILVRGDVDAATAPQLAAVVHSAIEDVTSVEFDMSELGFLDSTGISVIASTLRSLETVGGKLTIRNAPHSLLTLLRITDLLRFVELRD